jgi:excisionase family DNA binding protein
MEQTVYAPAEAAERLGVSKSTVWRLIREGELPTVTHHPKPGLKPRRGVTAATLETFIKERSDVA